jgi:hypothetical protein
MRPVGEQGQEVIFLKASKQTKNTYAFEASDQKAAIQTLYVKKSVMGTVQPDEVSVNLSVANGVAEVTLDW